MSEKKPAKCVLSESGRVYEWNDGDLVRFAPTMCTPAVAVPQEAYNEARSLMLETASYHTMDKPTQFCRVCGASDGRWPCAARINADEVLALLPEVP